jgi:hypothetical protein
LAAAARDLGQAGQAFIAFQKEFVSFERELAALGLELSSLGPESSSFERELLSPRTDIISLQRRFNSLWRDFLSAKNRFVFSCSYFREADRYFSHARGVIASSPAYLTKLFHENHSRPVDIASLRRQLALARDISFASVLRPTQCVTGATSCHCGHTQVVVAAHGLRAPGHATLL